MLDFFILKLTTQKIFNIMVSFSFFIGIILIISPKAFYTLNKTFQREYGIRKRVLRKLEDVKIDVIDKMVIKNRIIAGLIISVVSFVLLLVHRQ